MALSGSTRGAGTAPASPPAGESGGWGSTTRSGSTAAAARNRRRPHQDGAEQAVALAVGHQLLVDAVDPVQQQQLLGAGGGGVGVADGAHVHPISLSLVDMSAPIKRLSPPHGLATAARAIW